jgi:hypothetical protein
MLAIILLTISNIFMTIAWYGHLKYQNVPMWKVTLVSWGIAFFRILLSGAGKSLWEPHLQHSAVENHPGNHHFGGVCRFLHLVSEAGHQVEPRGWILLYRSGGILHF